MINLSVAFTFHHELNNVLDDEIQRQIRRKISIINEKYGFGETMYGNGGRYANTFAIPSTDDYFMPENELFVCYSFTLPLQHGDLGGLLSDGVQELHNFIRNSFPQMILFSRITYTNNLD